MSALDDFKAIHVGIGVAKGSKQKRKELKRTRGSKEYVGKFAGTGTEAFHVIVVGALGDHRR